jgi:hypothetical protein
MKLVCVRPQILGLTLGQVYTGHPIWKIEDGKSGAIKMVVFNDSGKWYGYSPSYFEPA